jgi:hypothetical protein
LLKNVCNKVPAPAVFRLNVKAHDQPLVAEELAAQEAVSQSPAAEDRHPWHIRPAEAGLEHPANFLGKCEIGDSAAAKSAAPNGVIQRYRALLPK